MNEPVPPSMDFADNLYAAYLKASSLEDDLWRVVWNLLNEDILDSAKPSILDDISFDYYDESVEVYCYPGHDLSRLSQLYNYGFKIVWAHPHTGGRGNPPCNCPVLPRPKAEP